MKSLYQSLADQLLERNIRPSHQRLKILEYLQQKKMHPTVEEIFNELKTQIPTLSKSTVYNTLNLFIAANLVNEILIEENEARYDIIIKDHGHFKCFICGKIYDFEINIADFDSKILKGFDISNKEVYFKGTCLQCLLNKNNNKGENI